MANNNLDQWEETWAADNAALLSSLDENTMTSFEELQTAGEQFSGNATFDMGNFSDTNSTSQELQEAFAGTVQVEEQNLAQTAGFHDLKSEIESLLVGIRNVLPTLPSKTPVETRMKSLEQRLATLECRMAMVEHSNSTARTEVLGQIQKLHKWANKNHATVTALTEHVHLVKEQLEIVIGSLTDAV